MGSWSVYCGISHITISAGQECVLLPLIENTGGYSYQRYLPHILPIYGKYNDYGDIEDIEENFNTKIVEKVFGCSINVFCSNLTRRNIEILDEKICKKIKTIDYMWIDRKVYDFLCQPLNRGYCKKGSFNIGEPELLHALGFTFKGEREGRYKMIYEFDGKEIYSDGKYVHSAKDEGVYDVWRLKEHFPGLDISEYENKYKQNTYKIRDVKWRIENLGMAIGIDFRDLYWLREETNLATQEEWEKWEKTIWKTYSEYSAHVESVNKYSMEAKKKFSGVTGEYLNIFDNDEFCEELSKLSVFGQNMYYFSGMFTPYQLYVTPQCGEYETHQMILEKFYEINKTFIK